MWFTPCVDETSDRGNQANYEAEQVVGVYDGYRGLLAAETAILRDFDDRFRGDVLDIGVGGGRTVEPLSAIARSYVGVDYSQAMVDLARRDHPGVRLETADARDLSRFTEASFDAVVFSFNGIDSIAHEDRLEVLSQVRRVLRPDGVFAFSSHNRDYHRFDLLPWQRQWRFGRTTIRKSVHALRHLRTHLRMRRGAVHTEEYAVINDEAHDYTLMHYYITFEAQRRQLERAGFTWLASYDQPGRRTTDDVGSCWLHYVATPSCGPSRGPSGDRSDD